MSTRKHPRTLQEAFGPYTSSRIDELQPPMDTADVVVTVACALALMAVAIMAFMGWI